MIGASAVESQLGKLPSHVADIGKLTIRYATINRQLVVQTQRLPLFLPRVRHLLKKIEIATEETALSLGNSIAKQLPDIWDYIQIITPSKTYPEKTGEIWDFTTTHNALGPAQFKMLIQPWAVQLAGVIKNIDEIFQNTVRRMTQLSLAVFELQPKKQMNRRASGIATFLSIILNSNGKTKHIQEFSQWYSSQLSDLKVVSPTDVSKTAIYKEVEMERNSTNLIHHMDWLQKVLQQMTKYCAITWYSQLALAGPLIYKAVTPSLEQTPKIAPEDVPNGNMSNVILRKRAIPFIATNKNVANAVKLYDSVREKLFETRTYDTVDISFVIQVVSRLFSTNDDQDFNDDELLKISNACKEICGYNLDTFTFLLDASTDLLLFEVLQAESGATSLVSRKIDEIERDKVRTEDNLNLAIEALTEFEREEGIQVGRVQYRLVIHKFTENADIIFGTDQPKIDEVMAEINNSFIAEFGDDYTVGSNFYNKLIYLVKQVVRYQYMLRVLDIEHHEARQNEDRDKKRRLNNIYTDIEEAKQRIASVRARMSTELATNLQNDNYDFTSAEFRVEVERTKVWYEKYGKAMRTTNRIKFNAEIKQMAPFDRLGDNQLLIDRILNQFDEINKQEARIFALVDENTQIRKTTAESRTKIKIVVYCAFGISMIMSIIALFQLYRWVMPDDPLGVGPLGVRPGKNIQWDGPSNQCFDYDADDPSGPVCMPGEEVLEPDYVHPCDTWWGSVNTPLECAKRAYQSSVEPVVNVVTLPSWDGVKFRLPPIFASWMDRVDQSAALLGITNWSWDLIHPRRILLALSIGGSGAGLAILFWKHLLETGWILTNMTVGWINIITIKWLRYWNDDNSPQFGYEQELNAQWSNNNQHIVDLLKVGTSAVTGFHTAQSEAINLLSSAVELGRSAVFLTPLGRAARLLTGTNAFFNNLGRDPRLDPPPANQILPPPLPTAQAIITDITDLPKSVDQQRQELTNNVARGTRMPNRGRGSSTLAILPAPPRGGIPAPSRDVFD